eukprot:164555_1
MGNAETWVDTCPHQDGREIEPICHCGDHAAPQYTSIECVSISQTTTEKVGAIFLFLYDILVISICIYWLLTFWRYRQFRAYKFLIQVRRPIYMILSYAIILPIILEEGTACLYLFFAAVNPPRNDEWDGINWWTNYDGSPVYFSRQADQVLHFLYWFGFWSFFQLKVFKLWMLRYDYEYTTEMSNFSWREQLGLRTVQPSSFFLRYKSILGNSFLMFFMQLVVLVIIMFIQIVIRLYPNMEDLASTSTIEGVVILIIAVGQFIGIVWLMHQIPSVNDNFYIKSEASRIFFITLIGGTLWIIGLIVASSMHLPFILIKAGRVVLFTTWICIYCYVETIWVLKKIDSDWSAHHPRQQKRSQHDMLGGTGSIYASLRLGDILQEQQGFEAMMRFLVKEFSCENLLCYVELSQYITRWVDEAEPRRNVQQRSNDYDEENGMYIEDDTSATDQHIQSVQSSALSSNIHKKHKSIHDLHMDEHHAAIAEQKKVERFPYFENPDFLDELTHYGYIMQKYIYDSACLQINISGQLRHDAQRMSPGPDSAKIIQMINQIRGELWGLMRDSFTRFRTTDDYKRLADKLHKKKPERFGSPRNTHAQNQQVPSSDFSSQIQ